MRSGRLRGDAVGLCGGLCGGLRGGGRKEGRLAAEVDASVIFFAVALLAEMAQAWHQAQTTTAESFFGLKLIAMFQAVQDLGFCGGRKARLEAAFFLLGGKASAGLLFGWAKVLA
jgi:hypothetical protein